MLTMLQMLFQVYKDACQYTIYLSYINNFLLNGESKIDNSTNYMQNISAITLTLLPFPDFKIRETETQRC